MLLLAEGQTEEAFVNKVLAPHLINLGVYLIPTVVETKRLATGERKKGGGGFTRFDRNMRTLLGDTDAAAITMFYDYYAFPQQFPTNFPMATYANGLGVTGVCELESGLSQHFNDRRFKPYVHLHEFESFMFVNAEITAAKLLNPSLATDIAKHRSSVENAEAINDGVDTAPSKRILALAPKYQKILQGIPIAEEVGLATLRADCPRFNIWVSWLESLSVQP